MSRHRNIRSLRYNDECDFDDVYGRSLDEDISCISPTNAQFIYDRGRASGATSCWGPSEPALDEDPRLASATERLKQLLGNSVSEDLMVSTLMQYDCDVERSMNALLDRPQAPEPPKIVIAGARPKQNPQPVKIITMNTDPKLSSMMKTFKIDEDGLSPTAPDSGRATPREMEEKSTPKPKEPKIDAANLYSVERGKDKEHLYVVVVGHVDAGKSTLMGRLLCDMGEVNQRTLHKYEQESKKIGKQSFMYAWVLDETGEERLRGITMDVGKVHFSTATKHITVLDAPGHADFIPNMIAGAGQADVALLVIDATRGEFETGFDLGGQTREHALLVRSLGINQLAVAVNKLDTTNWSQDRFNEICSKLRTFLKQAGFKESDVIFVPLSGLTGENLVKAPTEKKLADWYTGPCLLEVIDKFKSPERPVTKPFRMSVNDIFKGTGSGFCISGKIETGVLNVGDKVLVCPLKETATVKAILINDVAQSIVFAGDQVTITLLGFETQNISIGNVLCDPSAPIHVVTRFVAQIVVFNNKIPITKGFPVILHHQSLVEAANIVKLKASINKSTGEVIKKKPRCLGNNSVALVEIEVSRPICLEVYKDIKELGRVMLRVSGVTVAAGLVTAVIK